MIPSLSQETIAEYASDAQTIQEPTGTDYTQGVRVGKTVPAKWWNWLFKGATRRLSQAKTDAQNMLTELQNVVTDAGFTLSASDSHQMSKAIVKDADAQIDKYVEDRKAFMTEWHNLVPSNMSSENHALLGVKIIDDVLVGLYWYAYPYSTNKSPWSIVFTTDLLHWGTVTLPQDSGLENTAYYINYGIVHYRDFWWVSINYKAEGNMKNALIRSSDMSVWETVFTKTANSDYFTYGEGGLVVVGNTLYFSDKYTTDGENWTTTTAWHLGCQAGAITGGRLSPEVVKIGNRYIAGSCYLDSTGWHALDPDIWFYNVFLWSFKQQLTLSNGNILLLCSANGLEHTIQSDDGLGFRDTSKIYILDAGGNFLGSTSYTGELGEIQIVNSTVFRRTRVNNAYVVQYSADGISYTDIPDLLGIPVYLNGYYYGCSKADSTKLLKSNNLTDWTVACGMPVPNTNHAAVNRYVPILQPTGFDNGIIAYTEFLGNGTTWKAGRMNNYTPNFCGAFSFKFKDMFVTITNDAEVHYSDIHHSYSAYSRLFIAATYNNTNRVIGHTLYLR